MSSINSQKVIASVEEAICKFIKSPDVIFVFPTETSAQNWADWTVENCEKTGVSAVAMERFTAWDTFKGEAIKSQNQTKEAIPATMRQVFAACLVEQNKTEHFFKNLITQKYAASASGFSDWIASLLPGLFMWREFYENPEYKKIAASKNISTCDEEDEDLLELYNRYSDFLEKNHRFEPAWEMPPFKADGLTYIIIYPEILLDFAQYKKILLSSEFIKLVYVPETAGKEYESYFYENSRIELHAAAEIILKQHKNGVDFKEIAVSVPDMDTYGDYLGRELELYQIPHNLRYSKPLDQNGAGAFFSQLQNCVSNDFGFESVKELLLNKELPWKNEDKIQKLIEFGKDNNCLVSFNYNGKYFDVWKKSFENPKDWTVKTNDDLKDEFYELAAFFTKLKDFVKSIVNAPTFDEVHKAYSRFREVYFDVEKFSTMQESDQILGRCISELCNLVDLEKDFPDCRVPSPYSFFTRFISGKQYLAQASISGVQVLPYRTAAASPFKVHLVVNAGQDELSVSMLYRQLNFLSDEKRNVIKEIEFAEESSRSQFEDLDPTEDFIKLYNLSSTVKTYYLSSEQTFNNYSFPNGYLKTETVKGFKKGKLLFENMESGFNRWKAVQQKNQSQSINADENIREAIRQVTCKYDIAHKNQVERININQSALKNFICCPRLWLFENVLNIKSPDLETQLYDKYVVGNINHSTLQYFCTGLKEKNLTLRVGENCKLLEEDYQLLKECVLKAINHNKKSAITNEILLGAPDKILNDILPAVETLCSTFKGYSVKFTEKELTFSPEGKDYYFYGKVDCVLCDDNGGITIIDFKSNNIPKNLNFKENDASVIPDFQLEMYDYLLQMDENVKFPPSDNCAFYNLSDCKFTFVKGQLPDAAKDVSSQDEAFEDVKRFMLNCAEVYVQHIKNLDFAISEKDQTYEVCSGCSKRTVCRKNFTVSGAE